MKAVAVALVALALPVAAGAQTNHFYVTTDLMQYVTAGYIFSGGGWQPEHEFWKAVQACVGDPVNVAAVHMPYRVPQFWDETELTIGFNLAWLWYDGHPVCSGFTDPADFMAEVSIVRLSDLPIDGGPYPSHLVIYTNQYPFSVDRSTKISPTITFPSMPGGPNPEPEEMVRIEFKVYGTEDSAYCQCVRPFMQHVYIRAPVVLPFIFENGFEEGHAAFWSTVAPL